MAVLLIKLKHIGDVLISTAAIRHLKEQVGDEPVCVLVRGGTEVGLVGNPDVADVFAVGTLQRGRSATRLRENWRLLRWLWRWGFRAVIDFSASDRGAISGLMTGAARRITYENPETGSAFSRRLYSERLPYGSYAEHQVLKDLHLVEHFTGTTAKQPRLRYRVAEESRKWADEYWREFEREAPESRRVVCHPTSRWMFKCWDPARMGRVLDEMTARYGAHTVITHGAHAAECQMAVEVAGNAPTARKRLLRQPSFDQLAALMEAAELYIGIDTAPMHLAAAVDTRVVALFGPSPPARWGPWCDHHRVVHHDCSCQNNRNLVCPKSEVMKCLQSVTEAEVLQAVRDVTGWQ